MIGFLGMIIKFCSDILMRLVGLAFLYNADSQNYEDFGFRVRLSMSLQLLGVFLIFLFFDRNELDDLQRTLHDLDNMDPDELKDYDMAKEELKYRAQRRARGRFLGSVQKLIGRKKSAWGTSINESEAPGSGLLNEI